jgi:diguanylate cyclase (GGDEF)-like protein/PAS domain S-box-containing protein
MIPRSVVIVAAAVALLASPAAAPARPQGEPLVVVVNRQNPATTVSTAELRRLVLGERSRWPNGRRVVLALREPGAAERALVVRRVCGMSEQAFRRHYLHGMFAGDLSDAPRELTSANGVIRFVYNVPGAIGFVRSRDADSTVKIIAVNGLPRGLPRGLATRKGALLFVSLAALAMVVAVASLLQLRAVASRSHGMYEDLARGLDIVGSLQFDIQEARRRMLYALTTRDANLQVRYVDESRAADGRVAQLVARHARTVPDSAGRAAVDTFRRAWAGYLAVRDEVIARILEGDVTAAVDIDLSDGVAAFERARGALVVIQRQYSDRAAVLREALQDASRRSSATLVAVLILAQVLAVLGVRQLQRAELAARERVSSAQLGIAAEELRRKASLLGAALAATADGILVLDRDNHITLYNSRFAEMWKLPAELLAGADDTETLAYLLAQVKDQERTVQRARELQAMPEADSFDEVELVDGRVFERFSRAQRIEGEIVGRVWSFRDVTERKVAERRLQHDAFHDALTFLPNRLRFTDLLNRSLQRALRRDEYQFAVLFLDIDRFKVVNDSLGHAVGDQLLISVARRLEHSVRPGDTVARLGGDEFTVLLDDIAAAVDAVAVAERIQAALAEPFALGAHEVVITASIGIAQAHAGLHEGGDLLRDADLAMYRAKAHGKARYEVFDHAMHADMVALLRMETELRHALERGELAIYFQPLVALSTLAVQGFEALVRWRRREFGMVGPDEFLHVAEETGLIVPIGQWMLERACAQLAQWRADGLADDQLAVSVNISPRQFMQPDLAECVAGALMAAGVPARCLRLEVTENVILENVETSGAVLQRLRALGVRLDLDDFGTGYSSLSYLQRYEMDALKIDRSFVRHIGDRGHNAAIVRTVVTLARNLEMQVVGEGVETYEQAEILRELGCDLGQGYLFGPPLPAEQAGALLNTGVAI